MPPLNVRNWALGLNGMALVQGGFSRKCKVNVSVRPSGAGLRNMSGQECTFSFMYTCIGYKLPTFGEYMLVGGFLCALRAQGWGICLVRNVHFLICILVLDINCQQVPPGQVPLWTSSPRTTSPRTSSPTDNFPPDKFPWQASI